MPLRAMQSRASNQVHQARGETPRYGRVPSRQSDYDESSTYYSTKLRGGYRAKLDPLCHMAERREHGRKWTDEDARC